VVDNLGVTWSEPMIPVLIFPGDGMDPWWWVSYRHGFPV
jgi:hypothetical protein